MSTVSTTAMVVEDSRPFRRWLLSMLQRMPKVRVECEVSDGEEAVVKAAELQPDLILLDIGLPKLNGIEAASQIGKRLPKTKLLFVSQEDSIDIVRAAFAAGAKGYVVKADAGRELMTAVNAVLSGDMYVSSRLAGHDFGDSRREAPTPSHIKTESRHEAVLYSDDRSLIDEVTQFVGAALHAGNAAIVVATDKHRDSLLSNLQAYGLDIGAAIEEGRCIAVDAAETISAFMVNNMLDPERFMKALGNLIQATSNAAKGKHSRVAFFGEGAHLLWTQGNVQAALQDEKLCNQVTKMYNVDILCSYSLDTVKSTMHDHIFQAICAEHSAVHSG